MDTELAVAAADVTKPSLLHSNKNRRIIMSKRSSGISPALAALTTAAVALPGISNTVQAAVAANEPKLSLLYTRYDEDSIPSDDAAQEAGDRDRYEIDVLHVQFLYPLSDKWQVTTGFVLSLIHI